MNDALLELARHCYGYGSWDAPFWFLGPEQGMSDGDLQRRVKAWKESGGAELSDCKKFHTYLGEQRWHREYPRLQFTWRKLMLLLGAFQGKPCDIANGRVAINERLRLYQRDRWGREKDETCVIELSGLPAPNVKTGRSQIAAHFTTNEFENLRQDRMAFIGRKMFSENRMPQLVVMYGKEQWQLFESIIDSSTQEVNIEGCAARVLRRGHTNIALAQHPNRVRRGAYWVELGKELRRLSGTR